MKRSNFFAVAGTVLFLFLPLYGMYGGAQEEETAREIHVVLETTLGEIEIAVDARRAPISAQNFLRYVDGGFYDGGQFHRTVTLDPDNQPDNKIKIEVIQASMNAEREKDEFPPIPLERTNQTGILHKDGVVSMARLGPDTATHHIFICVGDQPSLDFGGKRNPDEQGFAAFGKVIRGMDVVKKIQASPAEGQTLAPPIKILRARRVTN
jgi:peptidyl-prolyl cis-trans isomerase A (cyclophilin A)